MENTELDIRSSMNKGTELCRGTISSMSNVNSITTTSTNSNNNSVALVRERTIPTEGPQLAGEENANFWGQSSVA
jgi:hypothetical protein